MNALEELYRKNDLSILVLGIQKALGLLEDYSSPKTLRGFRILTYPKLHSTFKSKRS